MVRFLVTTQSARVESVRPEGGRVYMVDGTVPGWSPREGDYHWDHHRAGGDPIQINEIEGDFPCPQGDDLIVTTQVDADACVSGALLVLQGDEYTPQRGWYSKLQAIAWDCDHLHVPKRASYGHLADFAAKAVADLKQQGFKLAGEMGLPNDRGQWSAEQREAYASRSFREGTMWLVDAALGKRPWPGDSPDAFDS